MSTTNAALFWTKSDLDHSALLVLGEIWWSHLDDGSDFNIAQVHDPVLQKRLWALDLDSVEIGRYEGLQEAMDAAQEYFDR